MSAAHTEGPWLVGYGDPYPDIRIHHRCTEHGQVLAVISGSLGNPEAEANGRLVAAAPDLYAALKRAREVINAFYVGMGMTEEGRALNLAFADIALASATASQGEG